MSSFTSSSSEAAVAAVATAAGEVVQHHMRRLSSPASAEQQRNVEIFGAVYMILAVVGGVLAVHFMARCFYNTPERRASFQLSPEQILGLMSIEPTLSFTKELTLAGQVDHPKCTICLSEFVEGEGIRFLPKCKHGFHAKCIETWLLKKSSCPTCRASCVRTSFKRNPLENQQQQQQQQQQQNDVDLEAAIPPETEMMVLQQQQQQNDVDLEAANPPEIEIVQQQQSTE